ncbi:VOC family protein [Deinococcus antarcticus]|uniref:VOC family protein n=1 Tax=Deinococcus antarcticus TaxID=1298767 RepID=A0ABV8AAP2_9DEIO
MTITPFLMFQHGEAEEAMTFYLDTFQPSELLNLKRHPEGNMAGKVMLAHFRIRGQTIAVSDSSVRHAFDFTPSMSLYVTCENEADIQHIHDALAEGGQLLMPLDNYGFSRQFAWVQDRYGVSWQLTLE